ncbi:MAG: hypothetical protein H5T62_13310 [Anaerolineae bacterium]|nr:hypothetical protein [Anaerolineae bacterium]
MAVKLGAEVGQLHVVNGVRQERTPCVGVFEQPTSLFKRRDQGRLFVIIELTGDELGRDALAEDLVQLLGKTYYNTPGSITAGLRAALRAVNSQLLRENRGLSPLEGRLAGVSCAVLRGSDLYIAQAGPALVYVSQRGEVLTFPDSPPPTDWLSEGPAAPLGRQRAVNVRFFHCTLQPGDAVVLAQAPWARKVTPQQVSAAVSYTDLPQAMANLQSLIGQDYETTAMLLEITGTLEQAPQPRPRPRPQPLPRRKQISVAEPEPRAPSSTPEPAPAPRAVTRPSRPSVSARLRPLGAGLLALVALLLGGLRRLLLRILPGREEAAPGRIKPARARKEASGPSSTLLIWLAAAIPIIIILLVVGMYLQQGSNRQAQFNELLSQAQNEYELGQVNAGNAAVAREHYKQALTLATQALEMRRTDAEAQELQRRAQEALDRIDNVYRLYDLTPLYTYTDPGSAPGRVIADGQDIFVLDRGTARVYHHTLNELGKDLQETEVIVQTGQSVAGGAVGELIDMAWRPDGGDHHRGSLLIMEGNGRLLEYDPILDIVAALPLGGLDQWRAPLVVGTYFDQTKTNFYVLDTGLNQILKYMPTTNLYNETPVGYITAEGVDLSGAVDMAIDGYVYILYGDGRVQKLYLGQPEAFELSGLTEPLSDPTAIFTANHGDSVKYLYVADAGHNRILRLTKEGGFVRQFRAADDQAFDQLRGVFVSEATSQPKLFVVSENRLYAFSIPPESNPE